MSPFQWQTKTEVVNLMKDQMDNISQAYIQKMTLYIKLMK